MNSDPLEGSERARFEEWCPIKIADAEKAPKAAELVRAYWTAWQARAEQERWISVEERLPDENEVVLVYCEDGLQEAMSQNGGEWFEQDGDWYGNVPTHWQPLPKEPAPPVHKGDS